MNKNKSAICLVLMTLLVAVLCFVCFVSFNYGTEGMHSYNSILSMTQKDADLGSEYGSAEDETERYYGGGFSAVYYPEGVISAKEYENDLAGQETETDKQEYAAKYTKVGSLYFENDTVKLENGAPNAEFGAQFQNAVELLTARFEALHAEDVRVSVADDYTVRVFVPRSQSVALTSFAFTGELTVTYGSSEDAATVIMPKLGSETINDYIKGAHAQTAANGTSFVVIDFTDKGRQALADATAGAADSSATMYFKVGDESVLGLSVSEKIDQPTLYISDSSSGFTFEAANTRAILIDSAANGVSTDLTFSVGDTMSFHALYGENALLLLYIAFAVCIAAMLVFFFVKYHLLGFAYLYTYLIFLCGTILCLWAIPFLTVSVETILAVMLTSALMAVTTAVTFENAKKEYALGKTMVSSVKAGYKRSFWTLFDVHIAVALFGFFTFFVALPSLSGFAFTLGLTAVFSGLGTLILTRFHWAIMMAYTPKKGAFCNFTRQEVEDDE